MEIKLSVAKSKFMNTILLFIFGTFHLSVCQDSCAPSNATFPDGPADCIPYSNSTDFCCFLKASDSPATYTKCMRMKNTNVFSIITVGNMRYDVDCHGIKDYEKYFPFENEYKACGYQNPTVPGDCWRFNTDTAPCCLSSTNPTFDVNSNPLCYLFPEDSDFSVKNFSKINKNGTQLYFSCEGKFAKNFNILFLIMLLLFVYIF